MLGRWKEIIVFDLYSAFLKNHMDQKDQKWLGILTPFSGLRVMARSGQGLIGQSEELDQLLARIFKEERMEEKMARIQDYIVIGGMDQMDALNTYFTMLDKCDKANLKIEPVKTYIFPKTVYVAGWFWRKGGYLEVSPHRKNTLMNTKETDIIFFLLIFFLLSSLRCETSLLFFLLFILIFVIIFL